MGDIASAMSDYQRAISLNPTCALAFFNAANLFFCNRQFEQVKLRASCYFHVELRMAYTCIHHFDTLSVFLCG